MLPNSRHRVSPWEMLAAGWPLFNTVNGWSKHCNSSIGKKKKKEGITIISTAASQLYRSFTLISLITTTLQFRENRCYFCCFSKEGMVLLRSENFLSRSRGQLVAELGQKGVSWLPVLCPFFWTTPTFVPLWKVPRTLLFSPCSLAAFSLMKNNPLPTWKD